VFPVALSANAIKLVEHVFCDDQAQDYVTLDWDAPRSMGGGFRNFQKDMSDKELRYRIHQLQSMTSARTQTSMA